MVSERLVSIENSKLELWGSAKHHRTRFNRRVSHNTTNSWSDLTEEGETLGKLTEQDVTKRREVEEEIDWRSATCLGRYNRCCKLSSMLDQLCQDKDSKALLAELRNNTAGPLLAA